MTQTGTVLDVPVSVVTRRDVVDAVERALRTREPLSVTFLNPTYLMAARRDPELRALIGTFDLVLADGWGVVWGARLLGLPVPTRLANDDIGEDLFRLSERRGARTFLFGSAPGVAAEAADALSRLLPDLPLVGTRHGWWDVERGHPGRFDPADEVAAVEAVNAAGTDVLWVGVPTPLQQRFVGRHRAAIEAPVVITGGAYLDHLTRGFAHYPTWVVTLRLCWAHKLVHEPRRLWRRYTLEMARFAALLVAARVRQSRRRPSREG